MRLFLATAMTDDGIAQASRALADDHSRGHRPISFELALPTESEIKTIVAMGLCFRC